MPLSITLNTKDGEALEAIVGPVPEDLADQWSRSDEVAPGFVTLRLDGMTRTVEINDFDPLASGIILGRFAQVDDRDAIRSWPLTGDLDFDGESYQSMVGASDEQVRSTAQSFAMMTELTNAIKDGSLDVVVIDMTTDPDTVIDGRTFIESHDPVHPEAETEHGGEG